MVAVPYLQKWRRWSRYRTSAAWVLALAAVVGCVSPGPAAKPATIRVAVCQIRAVDDDLEGNFARIELALAAAARGGAELACFPETSLLGWVNPLAHELADPIPGATSRRLGELARRYSMMIAIGLAEKEGDKLYDAALLLDTDGAILLRHRKVNVLTELMDPPYTPGTGARLSTAETSYGRIGMLVCADTFRDDLVGDLAAAAPVLVVVPYGWAAPPEAWPAHGKSLEAWVAHTARRAGCPVVGVDVVGSITHGPWRGFDYGGQSVVCTGDGAVVEVLADRTPEVRIVELALALRRGGTP